jgi:hypothetical protein
MCTARTQCNLYHAADDYVWAELRHKKAYLCPSRPIEIAHWETQIDNDVNVEVEDNNGIAYGKI